MTKLSYTNAEDLVSPSGHYSHAVSANGFVFISGLLPVIGDGQPLKDATFEIQARQALQNLMAVCKASGSEIKKLVQVRVYLADLQNWAQFNDIYKEWIGDARPARCVVPVPALHYGVALEIEAVALQ